METSRKGDSMPSNSPIKRIIVEILPLTVSYITQRSLHDISILCVHVLVTFFLNSLLAQRNVLSYLRYPV